MIPAVIVLDPDDYNDLPGVIDEWNAQFTMQVVRHELAHLVGLDHVKDRHQIMYGTNTKTNGLFGAGDLAGLAHQGAARGCLPGSVR